MIVVWEPMYPGDSRSQIPTDLFTDRRAVSYWDPHEISGTWLGDKHVGAPAGIVWDAYYAFARGAHWGPHGPTHLIDSASTVIGNADSLDHSFVRLLQ